MIGGEDPAGEEVDGFGLADCLVALGIFAEIEVLPELRGVDPAIFDVRKGESLSVDIVNSEEAGDLVAARHRRDEAGHPVIAVDQVRFHLADDVVDDFPLKGERDEVIVPGVID